MVVVVVVLAAVLVVVVLAPVVVVTPVVVVVVVVGVTVGQTPRFFGFFAENSLASTFLILARARTAPSNGRPPRPTGRA